MPGRVLIVDDDAPIRMLLAQALEGYDVQQAADGQEALARLATWHPDAILLDLMMPHMDGGAFARAYLQTPGPHAPLVLLTAGGRAERHAEEVRAAATLSKPFDLDDLMAVVERYAA